MIRKLSLAVILALTALVTAAWGQCGQCPQRATCATAASADDDVALAAAEIDPALRRMLDRMEARGQSLRSFQADMLYTRDQLLIDTRVVRQGRLYYEATDDRVRFRIHFENLQQVDLLAEEPGPVITFDEDFTFDGRWATRRDARTKMLQRYEISREAANRESFRLGEGPFPLPFAVTTDDVLREFDAAMPEDPCAPAGTVLLTLTPKPASSFADKYVALALWVDAESALPVQIRYEDGDNELTTVRWRNVRTDQPIAEERFALAPAGAGWTVEEHPLPQE